MGISTDFEIYGTSVSGETDPSHMGIAYIACDAPFHIEQGYISLRGGDMNVFFHIYISNFPNLKVIIQHTFIAQISLSSNRILLQLNKKLYTMLLVIYIRRQD